MIFDCHHYYDFHVEDTLNVYGDILIFKLFFPDDGIDIVEKRLLFYENLAVETVVVM